MTRILISGLFFRKSAWCKDFNGYCYDDIRDEDLNLSDWLKNMSSRIDQFSEVELIGHSFGGYLAQCLTAVRPEKVSKLWLISALVSQGEGAFETYQQSGQGDLMSICKLDLIRGRILLESPHDFQNLMGNKVTTSNSESAQLLIDPPPRSITNISCPVNYVITEKDNLTPASLQRQFALRLNAKPISWQGNHISPLLNSSWLK